MWRWKSYGAVERGLRQQTLEARGKNASDQEEWRHSTFDACWSVLFAEMDNFIWTAAPNSRLSIQFQDFWGLFELPFSQLNLPTQTSIMRFSKKNTNLFLLHLSTLTACSHLSSFSALLWQRSFHVLVKAWHRQQWWWVEERLRVAHSVIFRVPSVAVSSSCHLQAKHNHHIGTCQRLELPHQAHMQHQEATEEQEEGQAAGLSQMNHCRDRWTH